MDDKELDEMMKKLSAELESTEAIEKEQLERAKPILEKVQSIYSVKVTFEYETETEWYFNLNDNTRKKYPVRVVKETMELLEDDHHFCFLK